MIMAVLAMYPLGFDRMPCMESDAFNDRQLFRCSHIVCVSSRPVALSATGSVEIATLWWLLPSHSIKQNAECT